MEYRSHRIREMDADDRPRERLEKHGAGVLSSAELVAIILNTGTVAESVLPLSHRILAENNGLTGLMRMEVVDLAKLPGIGPAKAAKLKAALEMGRRLSSISEDEKPRISAPEDIVRILGVEMASLEREQLRLVMLNTKHHIIATSTIAQGTVNSANVRMAEVFSPAVKRMAPYVMLVHNHPTGDPTPSPADVQFTGEAVRAGKLLDIVVLDHIVIGQGRHVSLKRLGLGFGAQEEP